MCKKKDKGDNKFHISLRKLMIDIFNILIVCYYIILCPKKKKSDSLTSDVKFYTKEDIEWEVRAK